MKNLTKTPNLNYLLSSVSRGFIPPDNGPELQAKVRKELRDLKVYTNRVLKWRKTH